MSSHNGQESLLRLTLLEKIEDRFTKDIELLKQEASAIQSSANEETKSSAGDKYETGRAMAHLELEKIGQQIAEKLSAMTMLGRFKTLSTSDIVQPGSIVETNVGIFFISTNAGAYDIDGMRIQTISPNAPIARLLIQKQAGFSFEFNSKKIEVNKVL